MHAFNPSPRGEYKMGGDSSQTQSHSEILGGRIAISDLGRGKNQWLAVLRFWLSHNICLWVFINHATDFCAPNKQY